MGERFAEQGVGRCGELARLVTNGDSHAACALPHGHPGWHRADDGMEWNQTAEKGGGLAEPASEDEGLRDHAYYFGFTQTGVGIIDRILSEVCRAGKGYHSTEFWQDEDPRVNGGKSYEASIQAAADAAAAAIRQASTPPGPACCDYWHSQHRFHCATNYPPESRAT